MHSYRVSLAVGMLHPGTAPEAVLPAAADVARRHTTVEASDVGVVAGQARITVRYLATDDDAARAVAATVADGVAELAQVSNPRLTRRYGGRWYPADGWRPRG
ncbi:hypothetical protein [Oerskovia flava]|uniref:hypothetical protein n=1 Tax=Oerskovia flava TaxID=2986422 RepID=UPI00223F1147|nr:hypothetical protein [Oerskovia sp. JB1-3-2]